MKFSRKSKAFIIAGTVLILLIAVDVVRVEISLHGIMDQAELGMSMDAAEEQIGPATSSGEWWGSLGSGTVLYYERPYVWMHVFARLPEKIGFHPFYIRYSSRWYHDNSPQVMLWFDEDGLLMRVEKRGFASQTSRVMRSSRH